MKLNFLRARETVVSITLGKLTLGSPSLLQTVTFYKIVDEFSFVKNGRKQKVISLETEENSVRNFKVEGKCTEKFPRFLF